LGGSNVGGEGVEGSDVGVEGLCISTWLSKFASTKAGLSLSSEMLRR